MEELSLSVREKSFNSLNAAIDSPTCKIFVSVSALKTQQIKIIVFISVILILALQSLKTYDKLFTLNSNTHLTCCHHVRWIFN